MLIWGFGLKTDLVQILILLVTFVTLSRLLNLTEFEAYHL